MLKLNLPFLLDCHFSYIKHALRYYSSEIDFKIYQLLKVVS